MSDNFLVSAEVWSVIGPLLPHGRAPASGRLPPPGRRGDCTEVPNLGATAEPSRPDRLLADKGYTPKANRTWLAGRGIKATIPEKV